MNKNNYSRHSRMKNELSQLQYLSVTAKPALVLKPVRFSQALGGGHNPWARAEIIEENTATGCDDGLVSVPALKSKLLF